MKLKLLFGVGVAFSLSLLLSGCGQGQTSSNVVEDTTRTAALYDPNLKSDSKSYLTKCKIKNTYVFASYTKATLTGASCVFSSVKCTGAWKDRCASTFAISDYGTKWGGQRLIYFNRVSASRFNYYVF